MNEREGEIVLNLSDFNDRWNKMALGISDHDVPSRTRAERDVEQHGRQLKESGSSSQPPRERGAHRR